MNDPMKSTMGALGAFAVTGGMLVGIIAFTTPAFAAEKPVRGTAECTQQVNATPTVRNARADVVVAQDTLVAAQQDPASSPTEINEARVGVENAENRLAIVLRTTTGQLCREGSATPEPTTPVTPPVTTQPEPEPTAPVTPPSGGQTTVVEPTRTVEVPAPTTSVDLAPRVNTNVEVDPTDDDDSLADVSGSQVSVVPEGSADTGAL